MIAHAYEMRLAGQMTVRQFMLRRVIRLYPLYLVGTVIGIAVGAAAILFRRPEALSPALFAGSVATGLLMLPALPAAGALFPLNSPAWSLSFELMSNVAFATLLRAGKLSDRWLAATIIAGGAALILTTIAYGGISGDADWLSAPAGGARVGFSFFAGVGLYRIREALPNAPKIPAPVLGLTLLLLFAIQPPGAWDAAYQLAATMICFPALVFLGARVEPAPVLAPIFRVLGLTSYGLYALHKPTEELLVGALTVTHVPIAVATPWAGWAFLTALIAVSALAHRYFDAPIRARAADRLLARPGVTPRSRLTRSSASI